MHLLTLAMRAGVVAVLLVALVVFVIDPLVARRREARRGR